MPVFSGGERLFRLDDMADASLLLSLRFLFVRPWQGNEAVFKWLVNTDIRRRELECKLRQGEVMFQRCVRKRLGQSKARSFGDLRYFTESGVHACTTCKDDIGSDGDGHQAKRSVEHWAGPRSHCGLTAVALRLCQLRVKPRCCFKKLGTVWRRPGIHRHHQSRASSRDT